MDKEAHARLRPFYFTGVFWGPVHRAYFADLLLASLLAPNNIPALNPGRGSKFLVATTRHDWNALQTHPMFRRLRTYMEPVWFHLDVGTDDSEYDRKMRAMSRGHRMMASRAYQDRAYGVYIANDTVMPDGSVAAMERLVETGKKVVVVAAVRFQYEGVVAALKREGCLRPGEPLVVSRRDAMRIGLRFLHSETRRWEYDAPYFTDPICVYRSVPDHSGVVLHSFSWAPVVVDYAALPRHDMRTFDSWTLDGDYIHQNFPDPADVHVVTDSDEIGYLSVTQELERHFSLNPVLAGKSRWITSWYRSHVIRALKESWVIDPLKRQLFLTPVYLHFGGLSGGWARTRRRLAANIARAYREARWWQITLEVSPLPSRPQHREAVIEAIPTPSPLAVVAAQPWAQFMLWHWRYRRLMWRRAHEKIGLVRGRSRWDDGRDWVTPVFGLMNPVWSVRWAYRYRRFVWQRLKEKTGRVPGCSVATRGDWTTPTVGPMNPMYSVRVLFVWGWRYRRFVVRKGLEKLGVARGRASLHDGRDWITPVFGAVNPIWSVRWAWKYRRFIWQRLKEKAGLASGCSLATRGDWVTPAVGPMNPIYTVRVLAQRTYRQRRLPWQRVRERAGVARSRSRV